MAQFKKKTSNKFWHSPLALAVLFCILVIFTYNMIGLIRTQHETAKRKELILREIDSLHSREEVLNKDIERLNTDEGTEELIREKYQVVKPGEKMIVIIDDQQKNNSSESTLKDHTFWGFIKRMFGK